MRGRKKLWVILISVVGILAAVYLGTALYFQSHFFVNTTANGSVISLKSPSEVEKEKAEQAKSYELVLEEIDGSTESLSGEAVALEYQESGKAKELLKKQNGFLWPSMFFTKRAYDMEERAAFDSAALEAQIAKLHCVTREDQTDPVSAMPEFNGEQFVVKKETLGTKLDAEALRVQLEAALSNMDETMNLEEKGCYLLPRFTEDSQEVKAACETLNNYCKASVTYLMDPNTEVVDKQLISGWLTWDENMNVTFLEDKVREYMNGFAAKYETVGVSRPLTTPWGKETEVYGGTYGWAIDEGAEAEALIASIKAGEVVEKQPVYEQQAATHAAQDWGNSFIEVDLSDQHMWCIIDGNVVLETDVVTGKPYALSTPCGVYDILMMSTDTVLVGNIVPETGKPEYETLVSYWMQVTWEGVGFHDATWQPAFGGQLYWDIGSHGCINMPLDMAGALYGMIYTGMPVVMHY